MCAQDPVFRDARPPCFGDAIMGWVAERGRKCRTRARRVDNLSAQYRAAPGVEPRPSRSEVGPVDSLVGRLWVADTDVGHHAVRRSSLMQFQILPREVTS